MPTRRSGGAVAAQRAEVELERVGQVHAQVAAAAAAALEFRHHVAVDLDDVERARGLEQRHGDRAAPGTDLDQAVAGLRRDGAHDAVDRPGIVQEVLAEALLGAAQGRRAAQSSTASRTAARRLPASARPVPARSRAVPWSTEVRTIGSPSVTFTPWPNAARLSTGRPWS